MLSNQIQTQQLRADMIINLDRVPFVKNNLVVDWFDLRNLTSHEYYSHYYYITEKSEYCEQHDVYLMLMDIIHLHYDLNIIVPNEIVDRLKNKEILLCLDYLGEAMPHIVGEIYRHLVDRQGIPPSQIILVQNSTKIKEHIERYCNTHNKEPIKYEVFYLWEKIIQRSLLIETNLDTGYNKHVAPKIKSPLHNTSFNKKFLFLNRIWRRHRTMMLMLLNDNDLLKYSHTSFHNMSSWESHMDNVLDKFSAFEDVVSRNKYLGNQLPMVLDTHMFEGSLLHFRRSMMKYYNDTYFSLITETGYENGLPFHPTEKTFKPILHKHPFVILTMPHYLKNLRDMGYRTFDGIIDESYDNIEDDDERMLAVLAEVKRLCNLNEDELTDFRNKSLEIVEYNFNVLMSKESFLTKIL